ncbi:hypothetical protein GOBAR_DD21691 [Gossypium barbadense]|nr:hypothetical protein GOBAR_DD21691 [Gossypium barbadense]
MGSNGIECSRKDLQEESVSNNRSKGVLKDSEQTDEVDESAMEYRSSDDQSFSSCYEKEENQKSSSEQKSSVIEVSETKQSSVSSTPKRGLDHCTSAPLAAQGNQLIDDNEIAFSRSMMEKKNSRHDLKIDRLSEREKKNLIVNLIKIQNDGTVEVDLPKNSPVASELLELSSIEGPSFDLDDTLFYETTKSIPRLNIAILVVGTRGDVQPFLAMAKRLQEFGHRVRLATHANFRNFVKLADIDFYPLGGDPRVLAGYMARNKGLIPSGPGEISIQRKQLKSIIESLLPACTEPDIETGMPFRAQAIIANPPAYGHSHVAEALGVPLHIFFTMPWTPTSEFPHPLARVPQSAGYWWGPLVDVVGYCFLNLGSKYRPREEFVQWIQKGPQPIYIGFGSMEEETERKTGGRRGLCIPLFILLKRLSYIVVDLLIWWGIRGYINDFRKKKLKLAPIAYFSTYNGSITHLPTGYMWSSHLVPKPKGSGVTYCAFQITFFLNDDTFHR